MQGNSFVHHDISSPVVHDITVHIMLVLMLIGKLAVHFGGSEWGFLVGMFQVRRKDLYEGPEGGFRNFIHLVDCCFAMNFVQC